MACAIAISSFLPLCQMHNGNVIVDFLTAGLGRRTRAALDAFSSFAYASVAGFFFWRMIYGAQDMFNYNEETMLLQAPVWVPFLPVVISFFVLSLCCLYSAIATANRLFRH